MRSTRNPLGMTACAPVLATIAIWSFASAAVAQQSDNSVVPEDPCEEVEGHVTLTGDEYEWQVAHSDGNCEAPPILGAGANRGGELAPKLTHYTFSLSTSDTQLSCFRVYAGYDGDVDPSAGRYADVVAAREAALAAYSPTVVGGLTISTAVGDGVYRRNRTLPCVDQPDEVAEQVLSPLQLALIGWQAWARPLAPSVRIEPTKYSVVGVPTLVSVDDYQPDYDIDNNPRTITWSLPDEAIQLRATAHHRIHWDDPHADTPVTDWLDRNGRRYRSGDEDDGFSDPVLIRHVYTHTGTPSVTVDVRWTGQWRVDGGPWESLPADPIYLVDSFPIEVDELQAVVTK